MGIPTCRIEVKIEGDLDLRGTLGVSRNVPVGFQDIRVRFKIEAPDAAAEQLQALREKTEQYCVVMQTLLKPPTLQVVWPEQPQICIHKEYILCSRVYLRYSLIVGRILSLDTPFAGCLLRLMRANESHLAINIFVYNLIS
jgi:hypothetical protein